MSKQTPALPPPLAAEREKILRAADTIRDLEAKLLEAQQQRDTAKAQAERLESQVASLNLTGSLRHIQYLDDALTRERTETVALRAEVIELRTVLEAYVQNTSVAAHAAERKADGRIAAPTHESAVLRSTIADLEERLERERALSRAAGDLLNREYVANLTAAHRTEMGRLREALGEAQAQLGDARRLLAAHGVSRRAQAGDVTIKY
jgi:hypothetical protein